MAKGSKALPKLGHLCGRERYDDGSGLPEAESPGYGAAGPALAERRAGGVGALEVGLAGGNLAPIVKAIQAMHRAQAAMVGGVGRGCWSSCWRT